jgi:hypothetical protein
VSVYFPFFLSFGESLTLYDLVRRGAPYLKASALGKLDVGARWLVDFGLVGKGEAGSGENKTALS